MRQLLGGRGGSRRECSSTSGCRTLSPADGGPAPGRSARRCAPRRVSTELVPGHRPGTAEAGRQAGLVGPPASPWQEPTHHLHLQRGGPQAKLALTYASLGRSASQRLVTGPGRQRRGLRTVAEQHADTRGGREVYPRVTDAPTSAPRVREWRTAVLPLVDWSAVHSPRIGWAEGRLRPAPVQADTVLALGWCTTWRSGRNVPLAEGPDMLAELAGAGVRGRVRRPGGPDGQPATRQRAGRPVPRLPAGGAPVLLAERLTSPGARSCRQAPGAATPECRVSDGLHRDPPPGATGAGAGVASAGSAGGARGSHGRPALAAELWCASSSCSALLASRSSSRCWTSSAVARLLHLPRPRHPPGRRVAGDHGLVPPLGLSGGLAAWSGSLATRHAAGRTLVTVAVLVRCPDLLASRPAAGVLWWSPRWRFSVGRSRLRLLRLSVTRAARCGWRSAGPLVFVLSVQLRLSRLGGCCSPTTGARLALPRRRRDHPARRPRSSF